MKKLVLVLVLGLFAFNANAQNADKAKKLLDEGDLLKIARNINEKKSA